MKTIQILLADDDQDDHDLFMDALHELNMTQHSVAHVYNGLQALQYLQSSVYEHVKPVPDIIVLDINMPKLDGIGTLARLKEQDKLKHIPAFILTTTASEIHRKQAAELGCAGVFTKPPYLKELATILLRMIEFGKS